MSENYVTSTRGSWGLLYIIPQKMDKKAFVTARALDRLNGLSDVSISVREGWSFCDHSTKGNTVNLIYLPITIGISDYVEPKIVIEFGTRFTGEPANAVLIRCDADITKSKVTYPEVSVWAMTPERTFWEKRQRYTLFVLADEFAVVRLSLDTSTTFCSSINMDTRIVRSGINI